MYIYRAVCTGNFIYCVHLAQRGPAAPSPPGDVPEPGWHRRKQRGPLGATSTHGAESVTGEGSGFPSALGHPEDRRCPKQLFPDEECGRGESGGCDGD